MIDQGDSDATFGEQRRLCDGINIVLRFICNDARVVAAFEVWCAHRGITIDRFRQARAGADADRDALLRAAHLDRRAGRAQLAHVARDALHLNFPWVPSLLQRMFELWVESGARGEPRRIPILNATGVRLAPRPAGHPVAELMPTGRGPRKDFARHVEWFCRATIQEPPATPTVLLRAYQKTHATTANSSLVANAIERVRAWLDQPIAFPWDEPEL